MSDGAKPALGRDTRQCTPGKQASEWHIWTQTKTGAGEISIPSFAGAASIDRAMNDRPSMRVGQITRDRKRGLRRPLRISVCPSSRKVRCDLRPDESSTVAGAACPLTPLSGAPRGSPAHNACHLAFRAHRRVPPPVFRYVGLLGCPIQGYKLAPDPRIRSRAGWLEGGIGASRSGAAVVRAEVGVAGSRHHGTEERVGKSSPPSRSRSWRCFRGSLGRVIMGCRSEERDHGGGLVSYLRRSRVLRCFFGRWGCRIGRKDGAFVMRAGQYPAVMWRSGRVTDFVRFLNKCNRTKRNETNKTA